MVAFWGYSSSPNMVAAGPEPGGHQALLPCGGSQVTGVPSAASLWLPSPGELLSPGLDPHTPLPSGSCTQHTLTHVGFWGRVCSVECSGWGHVGGVASPRCFTHLWARLDSRVTWQGALGQALAHCVAVWGAWPSRVLGGASAGGFGAARAPGARVRYAAHVWVAGAWRGRWAVAPGSRGASALCLWGLFPGASSAVFWVDA